MQIQAQKPTVMVRLQKTSLKLKSNASRGRGQSLHRLTIADLGLVPGLSLDAGFKSTNVCVSCSAHQILNLLVKGLPCVSCVVCLCVFRERTGGKVSLQGNMDPCALYAPKVNSTPTLVQALTWTDLLYSLINYLYAEFIRRPKL